MCETEISHMGKNNGNPDLVCEKEKSRIMRLGNTIYGFLFLHHYIGILCLKKRLLEVPVYAEMRHDDVTLA